MCVFLFLQASYPPKSKKNLITKKDDELQESITKVDTHNLVGVKPKAGEFPCGPETVDLLPSDPAEESSNVVAVVDNLGCRGIVLTPSDRQLLQPGKNSTTSESIFFYVAMHELAVENLSLS